VGRERPRRQDRGRICDAEAGSLTTHLCSDSCAGALSGRHKTPPDTEDGEPANIPLSMQLQRLIQKRGWQSEDRSDADARIGEGPTAP
jgi:hypothetical protein